MAGSGMGTGGALGTLMPVATPDVRTSTYTSGAGKGGGSVAQPTVTSGVRAPASPAGGGKGGGSVAQPVPSPVQGQFATFRPQGAFNVNQASAAALQQAMMGTQAGLGFQAPTATAYGYTPAQQSLQGVQTGFGYRPAQRQGFTLADQNIFQYESPYQQAVIDRTLKDLSGAQEKALNTLGQQATAARAFGGSRQGIAEAETRKAFAETAADTIANLRERGFQQALGAAQFDVGQLAGTEAANVAAQQAAQQFGATSAQAAQAANIARQQQIDAANVAARTAAAQYGATASQQAQQQNFANQLAALNARQGAASQLAGLGQQAFQTGQAIQQSQSQQGLLQQQMQQALIDAARGQYQGYVGSPQAALGAPLAALGATPVPQSSTQTQSPGLFNYLQAAAMIPGFPGLCWVAREVYGPTDPKWLQFREWVIGHSPDWFYNAYSKYGEKVAKVVRKVPALKAIIRPFMDSKRKSLGYK